VTSPLVAANIDAALKRAGLFPPSQDVGTRLQSACEHPEISTDDILEVTLADWGNEEQSVDDVLVVQTKAGVFVIAEDRGGLFKRATRARIRFLYEWYNDLIDDDEMAGASVVFLAKPGHKDFLLSFRNRGERDRMYQCLFQAHRGRFAKWGLALDPASYVEDFERFHAELVSSGVRGAGELYGWVEEQYGEFDLTNALGMAMSWRMAELQDEADTTAAARVNIMSGGDTWWRGEKQPESRRVAVRLCAQLYDEGMLAPPYDERSFRDEPLSQHDAGPKRLLALMTLAGYAHAIGDVRTDEWVAAAQSGLPAVASEMFPDKIREIWDGLGAL